MRNTGIIIYCCYKDQKDDSFVNVRYFYHKSWILNSFLPLFKASFVIRKVYMLIL